MHDRDARQSCSDGRRDHGSRARLMRVLDAQEARPHRVDRLGQVHEGVVFPSRDLGLRRGVDRVRL